MERFGLKQTADAATEPITIANFAEQVNGTTDDPFIIGDAITAARRVVEGLMNRSFITQTWALYLDAWPADGLIELPRPPAISITTLKYYDTNNTEQTWAASNYQLDTAREPGRLTTVTGISYPALYDRLAPITVTYTAGYGAASAVPKDIKMAIRLLVAHWYEHREAYGEVKVEEMPQAFMRIVHLYEVPNM